jgi:hypothetical protein
MIDEGWLEVATTMEEQQRQREVQLPARVASPLRFHIPTVVVEKEKGLPPPAETAAKAPTDWYSSHDSREGSVGSLPPGTGKLLAACWLMKAVHRARTPRAQPSRLSLR